MPVARGEIFGRARCRRRRGRSRPSAAQRQAAWEKAELRATAATDSSAASAAAAKWTPAKYVEYGTASNASFELLDDNSLLADGRGSFNDTYRVVAKTAAEAGRRGAPARADRTIRCRRSGPGLASNGNFVLTDFEVSAGGEDQPIRARLRRSRAAGLSRSRPRSTTTRRPAGRSTSAKGSTAKMNADHEAVFVFAKPVQAASSRSKFKLHHELNENYLIGRFALDFSETRAGRVRRSSDERCSPRCSIAPEKRSAAQKKLVAEAFAQGGPEAEEGRREQMPRPRWSS